MSRRRTFVILGSFGVLALVVVFVAGKVGAVPVPGVTSVFQTPGTCSVCHETWYDEAAYAFNPEGNAQPPTGVTIGCAECHPVQFEEYRLSAMGGSNNPLRPGCTNCHDDTHSVFNWFKHMYLADDDWKQTVQLALRDRELYNTKLAPRLAARARARFLETDSARCRECHTREDHEARLRGTIGEFRPDIPPHRQMSTQALTCVQCHQNLMHNLSFPAPWRGKPTPAEGGDSVAGRQKSAVCSGCHGADGNSTQAMFPSIAGQNANYIYLQLDAFKTGMRKNAMMQGFVAALDKQDMADLAAYFSRQKIRATVVRPKVLSLRQRSDLEVGASLYRQKCARCHGLTARGQGIFPPLAGQHPAYMVAQMAALESGSRARHSIMRSVAKGLARRDLALIADYVGALQ